MKPIAAILCLSLSSCAWLTAHKAQFAATGQQALRDALPVLTSAVVSTLRAAAQSPADANVKADWTDAMAAGLRTAGKAELTDPNTLANYIRIWSPSHADHWSTVAALAAQVALDPKLAGGPSADRLNAVATALENAAGSLRPGFDALP